MYAILYSDILREVELVKISALQYQLLIKETSVYVSTCVFKDFYYNMFMKRHVLVPYISITEGR